MNSRADKQ